MDASDVISSTDCKYQYLCITVSRSSCKDVQDIITDLLMSSLTVSQTIVKFLSAYLNQSLENKLKCKITIDFPHTDYILSVRSSMGLIHRYSNPSDVLVDIIVESRNKVDYDSSPPDPFLLKVESVHPLLCPVSSLSSPAYKDPEDFSQSSICRLTIQVCMWSMVKSFKKEELMSLVGDLMVTLLQYYTYIPDQDVIVCQVNGDKYKKSVYHALSQMYGSDYSDKANLSVFQSEGLAYDSSRFVYDELFTSGGAFICDGNHIRPLGSNNLTLCEEGINGRTNFFSLTFRATTPVCEVQFAHLKSIHIGNLLVHSSIVEISQSAVSVTERSHITAKELFREISEKRCSTPAKNPNIREPIAVRRPVITSIRKKFTETSDD